MSAGTTLLAAATTGTGTPVNCHGLGGTYRLSALATGTISAGSVTFEHALTEDFSGTWLVIGGPVILVTATEVGIDVDGPLEWVRARVSDDVTGGGTVTAKIRMPLTW